MDRRIDGIIQVWNDEVSTSIWIFDLSADVRRGRRLFSFVVSLADVYLPKYFARVRYITFCFCYFPFRANIFGPKSSTEMEKFYVENE